MFCSFYLSSMNRPVVLSVRSASITDLPLDHQHDLQHLEVTGLQTECFGAKLSAIYSNFHVSGMCAESIASFHSVPLAGSPSAPWFLLFSLSEFNQ